MAGISVGAGRSGRRALDQALPLVPFIDFMVCLIAFLMLTAAWTRLSRINATGQAPGAELGPSVVPCEASRAASVLSARSENQPRLPA